jgi:hypothetical protein
VPSAGLCSEPATSSRVAEEVGHEPSDARKSGGIQCSYKHSSKLDRHSTGYNGFVVISKFSAPTGLHAQIRYLNAAVNLSRVSCSCLTDFSVSKCKNLVNHGTLVNVPEYHCKIVLRHHRARRTSEGRSELLSARLSHLLQVSLGVVKHISIVNNGHNIDND